MVCGNAFVNFMFYSIALGYGPFTCGEASQLEVLFTRRGPVHRLRDGYMHVSFTCTAPVHSGQ